MKNHRDFLPFQCKMICSCGIDGSNIESRHSKVRYLTLSKYPDINSTPLCLFDLMHP